LLKRCKVNKIQPLKTYPLKTYSSGKFYEIQKLKGSPLIG
jgi:hypothetical protein